MTSIPRFTTESRIAQIREECLLALVGLRHALGSNAKGVLERCQIRTLELTSPDEACRVLETLTPDAIVLDCHHAELNCPLFASSK